VSIFCSVLSGIRLRDAAQMSSSESNKKNEIYPCDNVPEIGLLITLEGSEKLLGGSDSFRLLGSIMTMSHPSKMHFFNLSRPCNACKHIFFRILK
jgi:hypothetical protein